MAEVSYDYPSSDFPYGVKPGMLFRQVQESGITLAPTKVTTTGGSFGEGLDQVRIWFPDTLDAGDQLILDEIVAEHRPSYDDPVMIRDLRLLVLERDGSFVYTGNGDLVVLGEL